MDTDSTDSGKQLDLEDLAPLHNEKRLLSWMFSKSVPPLPTEDERKPYPLYRANPFSRVWLWWLVPLMNKGYKRTLQPEDLWIVEGSMTVEALTETFRANLDKRLEKARASWTAKNATDEFKWPKFIVVLALLDTFKWIYLSATILLGVSTVIMSLLPLLTKQLIIFVEKKAMGLEPSDGKGVGLAIGTALTTYASSLTLNHYFHKSTLTGAQVKAVLTKVILDKSFKLNAKAKHDFPAGKITSMMGTDLARIDMSVGFQPFLAVFPIPIVISIALLVHNIGVAALAGIGLFLFSIFIMGGVAKVLLNFRTKVTFYTDKRVSYMREILNSMKMIKFYAWESAYEKIISEVRSNEMKTMLAMKNVRNMITIYAFNLASLSSMLSFCVLYALDKGRNPADIFSSVSLFAVLSQAIMLVPLALSTGSDALIAMGRVSLFLAAGEETPNETSSETKLDASIALKVNNASFNWDVFYDEDEENEKTDELKEREKGNFKAKKKKKENKKTPESALEKKKEAQKLRLARLESRISNLSMPLPDPEQFPGLLNLDFEIKKEEFVIITGLIGSGKSSLLAALSGFMSRKSGDIQKNGSLLLCGTPWVQSATFKENITFGQPYDEAKYQDVLYACALDSDLSILPAGDETEVGERGITLSGGQKARLNLARAVYNGADIILLDDVLSAVDARVGKHIMDNCLMGMLKDKTRILATHQLSLIRSADRVIFLNGDGTIDFDTVDNLNAKNDNFRKLMEFSTELKDEDEETEKERELEVKEEEIRAELEDGDGDGKLFGEEERAVNSIKWEVYKTYFTIGSGIFGSAAIPLYVVLVVLSTFCMIFTNTWLSFWTGEQFPHLSNNTYVGIYIMFTLLSMIMSFTEFSMLVYLTNKASEKLNIGAMKRILHTPMSFMDTTPMGRIMNRFTKDTDALDNEIVEQLRMVVFPATTTAGVLILCVIYIPWFAIAIPPIFIVFIGVSSYYRASSREIKRIEAIQRSFVFNNFNETLGGMNTIRAYNREGDFVKKSDKFINKMNEAYFITVANQRWLAIFLDGMAGIFVVIIALLCVTGQFAISASSTGLLLTNMIEVTGLLSLLIRSITQVENEMNSVERMCHYSFKIPQEADYLITEKKPRPTWPEHGAIAFEGASMAYREGLPLVLKDLNLDIKPSEKIGICGRTGAGKSSIMVALYRLSELAEGRISIDGMDIATLGLYDLRSKLSIIPQDPVLFQGTIRKNLDPFNEHEDNLLWDALRRSGLIESSQLTHAKNTTHSADKGYEDLHKFHLDQLVEDEGSNFSLGERQLIALARALVRDSKILILDEATSSVDYETDSKIQKTIVNEFGECTILCIAHRLKTIVNYDRILVLDKGELKELDTPWKLYNSHGIFRQMCDKSNIIADDFSRK